MTEKDEKIKYSIAALEVTGQMRGCTYIYTHSNFEDNCNYRYHRDMLGDAIGGSTP